MFLAMTASVELTGQNCDFRVGVITFQANGGNVSPLYTNSYVLTNPDGQILSISAEREVEIFTEGFYILYAVNYKIGSVVNGLEVGDYIQNVTGDCLDVGSPFGMTVCGDIGDCVYCLGETINLNVSGGNNDPGHVTEYFVTNQSGEILVIQDNPIFTGLGEGVYVAFAINYDVSEGLTGFQVGSNIADIQGVCKSISEGEILTICQDLNPTILFDLKGCNITQTALLQVGGFFESYEWSTGATTSFITVPARTFGVYRVTVSNGGECIGVAEQIIDNNEIATIGDFVWEDSNGDGIQQPNEEGLNGVTINLYTDVNKDGRVDFEGFPSCTTRSRNHPETGEPGYYIFNVYQTNYILEFLGPSGFDATLQNQGLNDTLDSDINPNTFRTQSLSIIANTFTTSIDAGFNTSSSFCGRVWTDVDADGIRESGEPGVNDIVVDLFNEFGVQMSTTITVSDPQSGEDGTYCFTGLEPGDYFVRIQAPDGQVSSPPNSSVQESNDSDATGQNGPFSTDVFNLPAGANLQDIDFGIYTGGIICGTVWQESENGTVATYDPGIDLGLGGVQIQLISLDLDTVVASLSSNPDGSYCIIDVTIGSYQVMIGSPSTLSYVQQDVGDDELFDSDVDVNTGITAGFFVAPRDTIVGLNAGVNFGVVPVDLVEFTGFWDRENDVNRLSWTTVNEINNEKFEIERATDQNSTFVKIGEVEGAGNSSDILNYFFMDSDIRLSTNYYYRLKQVDYDGGFEYSDIVAITVERNEALSYTVFPNPVKEKLFSNLILSEASHANADLFSLDGQRVKSWNLGLLSSGENNLEFDITEIRFGTYLLMIEVGTIQRQELVLIVD